MFIERSDRDIILLAIKAIIIDISIYRSNEKYKSRVLNFIKIPRLPYE